MDLMGTCSVFLSQETMLDHEVYASHVGRIHNSLLTVILLSYIIVVPRILKKTCFDCKAIIL